MSPTPFHARALERLLKQAAVLGLSRHAKQHLQWLLFAAQHDGDVALTCRHFGIARSTFLRWAERFRLEDIESLEERSRRPHHVRGATYDPAVVEIVRQLRQQEPYSNKQEIRDRLAREHGYELSAATVGRIIQKYGLFFGSTPAHRAKRRAAAAEVTKPEHEISHTTERSASHTPVEGWSWDDSPLCDS